MNIFGIWQPLIILYMKAFTLSPKPATLDEQLTIMTSALYSLVVIPALISPQTFQLFKPSLCQKSFKMLFLTIVLKNCKIIIYANVLRK